jgi:N-acetylglucosamine kinase-like BadF-type ATPase
MGEHFILGADVGGTKTHVLIADECGRALGFGQAGPGNHDTVGYEGLTRALQAALAQALQQAGLHASQVGAAGWGIAGFDWPSQLADHQSALAALGVGGQSEIVNDTVVGLMAGAPAGWGVGLVAGTGCNCWGVDRQHRLGRAVGRGRLVGEAAGAIDLAQRAIKAIADEWAQRGPATQLTPAFLEWVGARSPLDFLEGLTRERYVVDGAAARLVFAAAARDDAAAVDCIRWAGRCLAELSHGVIRQLELEAIEFDVVLIGSLFEGGPLLTEEVRAGIQELAPGARLARLQQPPVIGGVLLGMRQLGLDIIGGREQLIETTVPLLRQQPAAGALTAAPRPLAGSNGD